MGTPRPWAAYGVSEEDGAGAQMAPPCHASKGQAPGMGPPWGPAWGEPVPLREHTQEGTGCSPAPWQWGRPGPRQAAEVEPTPLRLCRASGTGCRSDAAALSLSFATETAEPGCSSRSDSAPAPAATSPCHAMPCRAVQLPRGWRHGRGPVMPSPAPRPCSRAQHCRLPRSRRHCLSHGRALGPGVAVSAGADGPPPCLTLTHACRFVAALASWGWLHVSCGCRHRLSHTHTRLSHTLAPPVAHAHPPMGVGVACLTHARARHRPRLCLSLFLTLTLAHTVGHICVSYLHMRVHTGLSRGLALPVACTHRRHGPQLCPLCTHT